MEKLAILGGKPVKEGPFPQWPVLGEEEKKAILEVLESGKWWELEGHQVKDFEKEFAEYQQAEYGICVLNGTLGLEIALRALDVGIGDEVITTPYTFFATASAILQVGAIPIFVDIDPETYLMNLDQVEGVITEKTKALLPVHLGGQPINLTRLKAIAQKHDLAIIEDACQAWGSEWSGQRVGAIGDLGVFSFQASKNITSGEGGIILTNDQELEGKCWSIHNCGRKRNGLWYEHVRLGINCRLTEWQGAILRQQIKRAPEQAKRREENAWYLRERLQEIEGFTPLKIQEEVTKNSWHIFISKYDSKKFSGLTRDKFIEALTAEGIPCQPGYLPLNKSLAIKDVLTKFSFHLEGLPFEQKCPVAEEISNQEAIWFSQVQLLGSKADMDMIVEAIMKIQNHSDSI